MLVVNQFDDISFGESMGVQPYRWKSDCSASALLQNLSSYEVNQSMSPLIWERLNQNVRK